MCTEPVCGVHVCVPNQPGQRAHPTELRSVLVRLRGLRCIAIPREQHVLQPPHGCVGGGGELHDGVVRYLGVQSLVAWYIQYKV